MFIRSTLTAAILINTWSGPRVWAQSQPPLSSSPAAAEIPVTPQVPESHAPSLPTEETPPTKLSVGTGGLFQPGLLLQGWILMNHGDGTASTFRARRAEVHLKGEIVPGRVSYALMIDPAKVLEFRDTALPVANQNPPPLDPESPETVTAKQPVSAISVLQDFFITYKMPYVDISLGQFKIPVSWEGYNSSSRLLFPERALVSREFGDKRDLGLRLAKTFRYVGYSAGVFNGAALNNLDANNDKDLGLRLEGYPTSGLTVAGVVYASLGARSANVKDRYEADLRFERGPFLVQVEYIRARDLGSVGPAVEAHGFYGAAAWTFLDGFQSCLRVGFVDPDVARDVDPAVAGGKDEVWHVDAGLNYYVRKNEAKLQLAYSRFQYDNRTTQDEVILAAQAGF